jgi:hypothetical protein
MRLRTDFWVSALVRRVETAGAFAAIARRGAAEAGAVFVVIDRRDALFDLYGPAPQSVFGEASPSDRLFSKLVEGRIESEVRARLESEVRFDPDLWVVDIEDRAGRCFVELAPDERPSFTAR